MELEDDQLYIPQVKSEVVPKLKQEFETLDEVASFYNRYAKGGFSTRSYTSKLGKDNTTVTRKEYVCSKQGDSKVEGEKRRVQFLRSHRGVSKVSKVLSDQLSLVNLKRHKQFEFFGVQAGGIENVGFTQRDIYNYGSSIREQKKGHDGDLLYMHFENEKEKDHSFVYRMESDEEKKVTRYFGADSRSRRAYSFYGDVVIFDTTYNTNRYGMIFAPLTGVNNHGQTIIFACEFLNDETTDSFVWLFKEFLNVMPGNAPENAPKMIITDQDPAMTKAISEFRRGLLHQRNHELREDHINIEEKVKTAMSLDIEDDMTKVYTRKCFYEVQEQLKESFKYKLELLRENETESMFKIQDVNKLPVQYILKRWTKAARQSVVLDSNGVEIKDNKTFFVRRTKLLQHATYAIDKAIVSDEASQLLMESLDDFLEKFNRLSNGNLAPILETETPTI
uniref:protein FAR1-RELATED SEQUENCE 5-like n=1 Tax=Fragaria vesca subsp. vesca TaxID=101020 RepID=UPI0005CB00B6|nr:PREDICTED: protein FAR1-RELATED SEQUENCE 5-like [Fragaria vesca subsp. vesca]